MPNHKINPDNYGKCFPFMCHADCRQQMKRLYQTQSSSRLWGGVVTRIAVGFLFLIMIALGGLVGFKMRSVMENEKIPLVHKLKAPLMLAGGDANDHQYLLPAGTSLYFDQAFPEGFVRYKVYVNVEGVSLDAVQPTDKFWLDPLLAFPVRKEQLGQLLKNYPLTKDELSKILASGALSKDDIKSLLEEYSR